MPTAWMLRVTPGMNSTPENLFNYTSEFNWFHVPLMLLLHSVVLYSLEVEWSCSIFCCIATRNASSEQ